MGNRVEELERQVAELRAAVDGLTEELVETKERVNALEAGEEPVETESRDADSSHAEFVPNHSADDHAASEDATSGEAESTDVSTGSEAEIVDADAADTGGTGASGGSSTRPDPSEATETPTDDEEDSDDDIIVA